MSSTASPQRTALLSELPWILGVLLGLVLLLVLHGAFQPVASPTGADWWEYRLSAHVLQHPEHAHYYPPWRATLYPVLLGELGEALGYALATTLISSSAVLLMVLGAAFTARVLAGPWAGAAAALGVALMPMHAFAVHWTNPYPLIGGLCALGVAAAVAAARWPRWPWYAAAGLLAGLGWATDSRGALLVPLCLALVAVAPRGRLGASWKKRALALAIAAACIVPGRALERSLAVKPASSALDVAAAAVDPAGVVPNMNPDHPDPHAPPPPPEAGQPAWKRVLATSSFHQAREGVRGHATVLGSLPPPALLWLLPLALLPGGRGWRGSLAAAGVLCFASLQVAVPAWLTDFGARYAYFFMGSVAALLATAPFRALGSVPRLPRRVGVVIASIAALVLVLVSWHHRLDPGLLAFPEDRAAAAIAPALEQRMQPGDGFMECGVLGTETHWYPRQLHQGDLNPYGADWEMCRAWVRRPSRPGERRWLVSVTLLTNAPPESPGPPFSSSIPDPGTQGWTEVQRFRVSEDTPEIILWRKHGEGA